MEAKSFRDTLRMSIRRGVVPCAKKVVVYGPEGIGKSTLASRFPEPLPRFCSVVLWKHR